MLTHYKTNKRGRVRGYLATFFMITTVALTVALIQKPKVVTVTECGFEDAVNAISLLPNLPYEGRLVPLPKRKPV